MLADLVPLSMNWLVNFETLALVNLTILVGLFLYLTTKVTKHRRAICLLAGLAPLFFLQLGSTFFSNFPGSPVGARLILLGTALFPAVIVPVSRIVARAPNDDRPTRWLIYHAFQIAALVFFLHNLFSEKVIEWVTAILDQPIILIAGSWRFYFLNVIGASVLALLSFDRTLQQASKVQQDYLKFILISFVSFAVFFSYLSVNIILGSYVSLAMLQLGAVLIFLGTTLLVYSFGKYPLWEVNIRVSRSVFFGGLSVTGMVAYLVVSGMLLDFLRAGQPGDMKVVLPVVAFALLVPLLFFYLSPTLHSRAKQLITRHFFRNKYDYRDLWMKFSQKSSGSLNIHELLPRIGEFIADAMFVRHVAFWLRSPTGTYRLAYCHDSTLTKQEDLSLHLTIDNMDFNPSWLPLPAEQAPGAQNFPAPAYQTLRSLGIRRLKPVANGTEVLALIGIGTREDEARNAAEDEQFLSSVSTQLSHLILTHKLSDELLLAREWDSFNRFASFILHDLKNLATLQGMTLDNAKHFGHKPEFIADAFATFHQTTEKMITLIASLSVQRGQFSLKQQPVNILEVIAQTFDDLRLDQRNGVQVRTAFPPPSELPAISGDPELLQKAFTNLLLNAIQSLPKGEGAVEITVSHKPRGKITASIRDTGCGIAPERLETLFRPFQTTKDKGLGIGLCHTRSIIEVHGGQIRIESQVNAGTKVEVELPTL